MLNIKLHLKKFGSEYIRSINLMVLEKLKATIVNAYGQEFPKTAAMLVTKEGIEIFGVSIEIGDNIIYTTSITNVICNAVSEGFREFLNLYVYCGKKSIDKNKIILDKETIGLLNEFNINQFTLFSPEGELIINV